MTGQEETFELLVGVKWVGVGVGGGRWFAGVFVGKKPVKESKKEGKKKANPK